MKININKVESNKEAWSGDFLYNEEKANHLEYNAKKQVKKLVKTFVDKKVIVEYK